MPETLLSRYNILSNLGAGGFSEVYKAFDARMQRVVAIKKVSASSKAAPRALREAHAVALLNHPNIVTVYEFEEFEEFYYLIMEFVDGVSLAEILARCSRLTPEQSVAIGFQVCLALECAHLNQIIHRDIKPENLMVLPDGRVKVMDFGIARLKDSSITTEGDIVGTFAYMSPEQANGKYVGERTDIFSLGILIYQMLTGENPFESKTPGATVFKVLNHNPPPPSQINPQVTRKLDDVVLKALEKDPEARYETATQLRYKLERTGLTKISSQKVLGQLVASVQAIENEDSQPEQLKVRVWDFFAKRETAVKRLAGGSFMALIAGWTLQGAIPNFSLVLPIPLALLAATLISPSVGVALFLISLVPSATTHSLPLGVWLILGSISYWLAFSRKRPLLSIIPLAAPIMADLNLGFLFPLLIGLVFSLPWSILLSGLGCLALEVNDIFFAQNLRFIEISNKPLYQSLQGSKALFKPLYLLVQSFLKNPALFYQVLLWVFIALAVSWLAQKREVAQIVFGLLVGSSLLGLGYTAIPRYLHVSPVPLDKIMQTLSFSLIMLLVLLLFVPYDRFQKN